MADNIWSASSVTNDDAGEGAAGRVLDGAGAAGVEKLAPDEAAAGAGAGAGAEDATEEF
jgi:hypothetical protein